MSIHFILPIAAATIGMTAVSTAPDVPVADALQVLEGKARPTDGDSLRMGDDRIRLFGIDAPESAQKCLIEGEEWACGRSSRQALERIVKGQTISCTVRDMDRGRFVSTCKTADGVDINAHMVRRGWAVAYTQYSTDYVVDEASAKADGLALWRSEFQRPHDWRRSEKRRIWNMAAKQEAPDPDCAIKGNISRSGGKIYHMQGQQHYSRTSINERQGERWFCSPDEAETAGWRAARS